MGDVGVTVVPEVTVVPWVVEADGVAVYVPDGVNVVPGVPPEVPPLTVVTGMKQHCTLKTMSACWQREGRYLWENNKRIHFI